MEKKLIISKDGDVLCKCSTQAEGTIIIPEGVLGIRKNAFKNCKGITNVVFPSSINRIGSYAFLGCKSLRSISLPNGLEYIGVGAFKDCKQNESVDIPSSIKELPISAFENNIKLKNINLSESDLRTIGKNCFKNCLNIKEIVIPYSVLTIDKAFTGCFHLKKIILESLDFRIKRNAFYDCPDDLTIEYNGNEITEELFFDICGSSFKSKNISKDQFAGTIRMPNTLCLRLPECVENIEKEAFENCTGLLEIAIPKSVYIIRPRTFFNCTGLKKISLAEGVKVIESWAFCNCSSLEDIYLPDSLRDIDDYAFAGCTSLRTVSISQYTHVAATAFDTNNLKITIRK